MSFDHLGLGVELLKALNAKGYTAPSPIQALAIPAILDGQDILARAQTGTGKTDAFALPLVEILSRKTGSGRHPRALVLTPTRELALQVAESIKGYARRLAMRCTVVYGGVRIHPQIARLRRGIDILVATPGRLLDLAGRRHLYLSRIEFLVFDEADRMLDLGFSEEICEILDLVPAERRTMLFSATYTQQIRNLAGRMLKDPKHIDVTPRNTAAESVVQKLHLVDRSNKRTLLIHLITRENWSRVLIFTRTKHGANKLAEKLAAQGISAAALHSNKSQSCRTRTLKGFRNGEIRILVGTDVAARGLDISDLPYVVNYDMPGIPEDYVHRIGRTGRAGVSGTAVSLVSQDERNHLQAIEKLLKQKIPVVKVDGYTEDSDVPDFVLLRPDSASSEKRADKDLKELVARRNASKRRSRIRKAKTTGSGKSPGPNPKSRPGRRNEKAGKKPPRSGSRASQSSNQSKPRGRRFQIRRGQKPEQ
ncbi:ATP-dependent RNA helicase RhlE (EC [Olavius sp. associated proteobacterium Delta 1]|nr:ATP-dependent RNA helicase RhlE (EC [Olavius sp. associated proteobacterium Delta 1]